MKTDNFMILNRVFSQNTLNAFLSGCIPTPYLVAIRRLAIESDDKTNGNIISEIYQFMNKNYRNEYIYKNTLLNNLLSGEHEIETTTVLTEIPVCRSKADFIMINGKAEVYEIKTELDNLDKLEKQITDYYKAFDHVNIITCPEKLDAVSQIFLNSKIGIYELTKSATIKKIKESQEERQYLDHKTLFKILRKKEYESILSRFGELPLVSKFDYYKECFSLFSKIDMAELYPLFLKELKNRNHIEREVFLSLPYEVKSLVYFSKMNKKNIDQFSFFLDSGFGGKDVLSIS
jgi:hypothetical protein